MKIAIIDADLIGRKKHRFPNLACMKISGYYKDLGNEVELKLNYEKEKLFLFVYDLYGNLIERDAFINFDSLRSHLKIKLSSLALIYASKKRIECVDYFRYYKMIIYELKSFDVFLKLLEKNIVKVSIACRVSRSGIREGEQRNKNLVFKIPKENINDLFDEIMTFDIDKM